MPAAVRGEDVERRERNQPHLGGATRFRNNRQDLSLWGTTQ